MSAIIDPPRLRRAALNVLDTLAIVELFEEAQRLPARPTRAPSTYYDDTLGPRVAHPSPLEIARPNAWRRP